MIRLIAPIEVSIILACRNEASTIFDCVRSILHQETDFGRFELIVADGGSTDGTREMLQDIASRDSRMQIIDNPERIVSTGLNRAIAVARGQIIIRMDAHTIYAGDYVRQCVSVLRQTGADNVGGPALTRAQGYWQQAIAAAYHSCFSVGGARFHNPDYEGFVDTVPYGCWPRAVFSRVGGFDEALVRNQDDEFNLRVIRSGGKIWQSPRIKSWYHTRGSLKDLFRQYLQYGYWKVRVIHKHTLPASPRHVAPGLCLLSSIGLLILSIWVPAAAWGVAGLIGLYGAAVLTASFLTAARYGWRLLPILPIVFPTYHFSYGIGFLQGLWDVLLPGRPAEKWVALSRRSGVLSPGSRNEDAHHESHV